MSAVTHPRFAPRRSTRSAPWWSKAWSRAVEEAAYHLTDLRTGRALARGGHVGALTLDRGSLFAAVQQGDDAWTVQIAMPTLSGEGIATFVELVAAESGRIARLLDGDLPHQLVEDAEDAGVELLPYGGELSAECSCEAWAQPCVHGLAVLTQFTWLIDDDALALLHLRGLPREELLAQLHARQVQSAETEPQSAEGGADPELLADVDVGVDAALRAARVLELLEEGADVDHLL
ncbi:MULTISPECIES: SWIM zinc finger family protein [unclassified Nocardioides]|uniref:SWIM zinc finger family protein n=1 Tax=unclassified Nocardioides TaxID=2615069 RepID=UPI0006FC535E|nr:MULTISPECIES: hypothetical protein [unclassified Nocardioides]KQY57500.1 hypothetical protein ASD30_15040 [Nocardioides sp. Root140]KRF20302.1 hypothetical protein ASH02_21505 [Nocardioides sp. Soil796]